MSLTHHTPAHSRPTGQYTSAVEVSGPSRTLYVSGQGPVDPSTGSKYVGENIDRQARLALNNLKQVIEGSGFALPNVVKVTIFLTNLEHAPAVNHIYAEYFPKNPPARAIAEVAGLPDGQAIEIDAIANI